MRNGDRDISDPDSLVVVLGVSPLAQPPCGDPGVSEPDNLAKGGRVNSSVGIALSEQLVEVISRDAVLFVFVDVDSEPANQDEKVRQLILVGITKGHTRGERGPWMSHTKMRSQRGHCHPPINNAS